MAPNAAIILVKRDCPGVVTPGYQYFAPTGLNPGSRFSIRENPIFNPLKLRF